MRSLPWFLCLSCLLLLSANPAFAQSKKDEIASLIKDLKAKDPKARSAAADEIAHRGAIRASEVKDAIPALLGLVKKDKDPGVRKAAAHALGRIEPDPKQAVPVLIDALKDKTPPVRTAAATALGEFGPEAADAIPALTEVQKDKDRGVSRAAGMALRNIRAGDK